MWLIDYWTMTYDITAFLGIYYNNFKITLFLDPQRRKFSWRLIEIIFKNTKRYLREKKMFAFFFIALLL